MKKKKKKYEINSRSIKVEMVLYFSLSLSHHLKKNMKKNKRKKKEKKKQCYLLLYNNRKI